MHDVKHTLGGFKKVMKGAKFHKADYVELLSLLYYFTRLASTKGPMALEAHIEKPSDSTAFQKFPKILANHHATMIICDYLRMVGMNADDPHQIEDVMGRELEEDVARGAAPEPRHAIDGGRAAGAGDRRGRAGRDQDPCPTSTSRRPYSAP